MKTWMLTGLAALLLTSAATAGDDLLVGQAAPTLTDVNWVKGDPVKSWEKGQIYVLDFWATWCPPCKKSIPHINELAKAHRADKVNVIGVAVWPHKDMVPTKDFVADKGDGMDYQIAEDIDGKTSKRFMDGSLSDGIPTVFVIDRDGQVAWIGSPFDMDEPFAQIVAGKQDKAAFAQADVERRDGAKVQAVRNDRLNLYMPKIQKAAKAKDWATALPAADELLALDPTDTYVIQVKYGLLRDSGDRPAATAFGIAQVKGALKDAAQPLNAWAWDIVDPEQEVAVADRDLELALAAASRADELTGHAEPNVIDTLARVHFCKGEVSQAIELERKAVAAAEGDMKEQLQSTLDEYLKAAPKPAGS